MSSKKIISTLILFLISFNTMASNTKFTIPLKQWTYSNAYSSNMFDIEDKGNYIKTVKKADISIPSQFKNNKLYINSLKHTGFSKIYVNNKLIGDVGSLEKGKLSLSYTTDSLAIPPAILNSNGNNSIEIVTYRYYKAANPEWNISLVEKDNIYIKIDKLTSEIFPISFILICLIVIYTFFRFTKIGKDAIFFTLSVIFLIIFYGGATTSLNYLTQPFIIYAWLCLLFYFVIKNRAFSSKKIIQIGTIIVSGIVAFSILFMYNLSDFKSPFFLVGIVVLINSYFIYFIHRKDISNIKFINTGLIIGLVLNILTFSGSFGFYYMAQIIVLLSFIFNILSEIPQKMLRLKKYNTKLLDTLNKHKDELNKKDLNISSLKVENEEILREKSLFFSALSSNLRTPLNSIIGYSENLYSLENLDELHPLVTEIIIESDKIFQAINNIMDFSTRKFSNHELQLKDFRMKEIFDGSTYSSSTIAAFKKHIRYFAEDNSDIVLINGNPIIYREILTTVFHYLISLNPEEIEFNISNKGITDKFMNLVVSFNAINLKKDEIQIIDNIGQAKDVFTKYVKLYNIKYREELTDTGVFISFDFQCGISNKKEPNKISNIPDDSIISKSLAVLVVEDYIPNLNIVKLHLDKMGCDVFVATTGDEALSIFNRENIDVILMDIKMPIMDGWEATELIRASKKGLDTLIIGLTASSLDLDIRHCFESGMDDVLVKPIRKNQLFNKLDNFEKFKPEIFPTTASLRADYGISKIETDTLFTSAINQIEKQLEVIDILISAKDNKGMEKEMPAIINAALTINAFYYTRVIRNLYNAYTVGDKLRVEQNISTLKKIISKARNDNESLFWN